MALNLWTVPRLADQLFPSQDRPLFQRVRCLASYISYQPAPPTSHETPISNGLLARFVLNIHYSSLSTHLRICSFIPRRNSPQWGQGLVIIEASRSHSDTPHSVWLLWTSDQPDAETATWQHTTLTRDRHPCPRRCSNPQSQQANGSRPTP
jgi:hypothetical protein